jgi:hypothetical protein
MFNFGEILTLGEGDFFFKERFPLGAFFLVEMSSLVKGNFILGGNVITRRRLLEENIPNNNRHEQNKEKTYRTLKTCGAN